MKENETWETIKKFYNESFGFPEGLVELVSVMDILLMCVSGSSNKTISELFSLKSGYVSTVIKDWLGFYGWQEDLEFNPYQVYSLKSIHNIYGISIFERDIERFTIRKFTKDEITKLYRMCSQYYRYEDMINGQWY